MIVVGFYCLCFALLGGTWLVSLTTGVACIGGSPWKPYLIRKRENLAGYVVVMVLHGAIALFVLAELIAELR